MIKRVYSYDMRGRSKPMAWWKYPFFWIWELRKGN